MKKSRDIKEDGIPLHAVSASQIDKAIMWRWKDLTPAEKADVLALPANGYLDFRCRRLCGFKFGVRFFRKPDGTLHATGQVTQSLNMGAYDK